MNVASDVHSTILNGLMAREKVFRFKQFSVHNELSAMKVGTDGVLLGAWTDVSESCRILDIGTGTGLIALMAAQRCRAMIDAVEIDDLAASEADVNFKSSPWKERLTVINEDFISYAEKCRERYDTIISNPPFFVRSLECPDDKRTAARHTGSLSFEQLITGISKLLADDGNAYLITPNDAENAIDEIVAANSMHVINKTFVCPTVNSSPKRILWKISKSKGKLMIDELVIEIERHVYTDEYIKLTRDYYLNM